MPQTHGDEETNRLRAENQKLRELVAASGSEFPAVLEARDAGRAALTALIAEQVDVPAEWKLSRTITLPDGARILAGEHQDKHLTPGDCILVEPEYIGPGGRYFQTVLTFDGIPNGAMVPNNDRAKLIFDAWTLSDMPWSKQTQGRTIGLIVRSGAPGRRTNLPWSVRTAHKKLKDLLFRSRMRRAAYDHPSTQATRRRQARSRPSWIGKKLKAISLGLGDG